MNEQNDLKLFEEHLAKNLGELQESLIEIIPRNVPIVPITICKIKPKFEELKDFLFFVTYGMSTIPMNVPNSFKKNNSPYVELFSFIHKDKLAPDNKDDENEFINNEYYFIVEMLKEFGNYPHAHNSFVGAWHSLELESGKNFNQTNYCGAIFLPSFFDENFATLEISKTKKIDFLFPLPLNKKEIDFNIKNGPQKLLDKMVEQKLNFDLDINRKSLV